MKKIFTCSIIIILNFLSVTICIFSMENPTSDWEIIPVDKRQQISKFFDAIHANNLEFVEKNIDLVNENYASCWNPLGFAVVAKNVEMVKLLIAAQVPLNHLIKGFKAPLGNFEDVCTALDYAARIKSKAIIEILLAAGADHTIPTMFKSGDSEWIMSSFYSKLYLNFVGMNCTGEEDREFFKTICTKYDIKPFEGEIVKASW